MNKFSIKKQIKLELRNNPYIKYSFTYLLGKSIIKYRYFFFIVPFHLLYLFYLDKKTYQQKNIFLYGDGCSFFGFKKSKLRISAVKKSIAMFFFGEKIIKKMDLEYLKSKYKSIIRYEQINNIYSSYGYNMKLDIPVNYVNNKSRTATFEMQAWRFLNNLWGEFLVSNDLKVFYKILIYMDDWLDNKQTMMRFYDMAVGIRAIHIALALEISLTIKLERYFRKLIFDLAVIHISELTNEQKITSGNHAIWQMIGLKYLSSLLQFEYGVRFSDKKILELIDGAFDVNGVCLESSAFYHVYNISILNAIKDSELFHVYHDKLINLINKAKKIIPYLLENKTHKYLQIGDSEYVKCNERVSFDDNNDCKYYHLYIKDLHKSGYQWVYNDNFRLIFYKPKGIIHAHNDFLSFIIYYQNIEIFSDPGVYNYSYGETRNWFISDKAHNTFGVREKQFLPSECNFKKSKINQVKFCKDNILLSGYRFLDNFFQHKREISVNSKNYTIDFMDKFRVNSSFTPEIRYIFGKDIALKEFEKNNIEIFYLDKKIANFYLDACCTYNIYNKDDNFAWISREWEQKQPVAYLILNFNKHSYISNNKLKFVRDSK